MEPSSQRSRANQHGKTEQRGVAKGASKLTKGAETATQPPKNPCFGPALRRQSFSRNARDFAWKIRLGIRFTPWPPRSIANRRTSTWTTARPRAPVDSKFWECERNRKFGHKHKIPEMSTWFENSITRDCDVVWCRDLAGFEDQSELNRCRMVSAPGKAISGAKRANSDFLYKCVRIFIFHFFKNFPFHHSATPRVFIEKWATPPSCRSAVRLWTEFPTEFSLKKWQPNSESDFGELRIRKRRTENHPPPNWESGNGEPESQTWSDCGQALTRISTTS